MANYSELIATINDQIKANGNQEITGPVLNSVLQAMVSALGEGYQFMGVATPGTNPGTPDGKVFYIATEPGTYSNFNNIVNDGNVVALYNTASGWTSIDIGSPSKQWTVENIWYVLHGIFSGNGNLAYLIKDGYINSVGRLMLAENGSSVSFRFTVVIIPIKNNQKLTSNADYQYNAALYDADFNVIPGSLKTGQNQTITGTAESVYAAFSFTSALYGRQIVQEGEELTITDVSNPIANYVDLNLDENSKRPIANSPVALNFRNTVKYVDSVNYLDVAQAFKYLCVKSYNYEQYEVTIQRVPSRDETSDRRVLFYVWNRDTGEKAAEFVYNLASVNFITENIYMYEDSNVKVVFDYTAYSRSTFGTIHKTDLLLTYQSFLVSEMSPYQGRKYCSLGSSSTTYPWLETAVTGLGFNFNGIGKGGAHLYMDDDAFYADNYQSLEASSPANVIMNQVAKLFKLNSDSGYYPDVITLMSGLNDCYATLRGTFEDAKNANLSDFMEYYGWIKPYADHTWIYTK